jgi:outer membrane immunogenic protein
MKKHLVSIVALVVLAIGGPAFAADMPIKAPPMAAPAAPIYSWSGFYFGVHAGAAWGLQNDSQFSQTPNGSSFVFDPTSLGNTTHLGGVGGLQGGYNWQFAPAWVLGVEGDISWASLRNDFSRVLTAGGVAQHYVLTMNSSLDWLSSARGRIGYVANNALWYVTGGAAWGQIAYSGNVVTTPGFSANSIVVPGFNHTSSGWVAGGGVEYMATRNVLLRVEYLYYGLSAGASATAPCRFGPSLCAPGDLDGPGNFTWGNANVQVVRAGLGYKF